MFPMMILMLLCPLVCIYKRMQGRYVPNDDFDVTMPTGMYLYTRAGSIVPNDDFDVTLPTGMYIYTHAGSIRSQ